MWLDPRRENVKCYNYNCNNIADTYLTEDNYNYYVCSKCKKELKFYIQLPDKFIIKRL